jgi:arylformamidase
MTEVAYTAESVERGYNNRAAVPDHPQWFAKFAQLSAQAKAKLAPKLDLRYGPNPKETLDLFVPSDRARGMFVFIHGGYWRALDKADHLFVAAPFVARGYAVAVINYDLCPDVTIATIVDECRRAVAWLAREGERHGASATPMVVGGHSAGGHLAAMLVATPAEAFGLTRHPLAGAVSVSGVHDLRPLTLFSFNADFKLDDAQAASLSPILKQPAADVPVVVAVGSDETSEFIRQADLLWDAWPENRPLGDAGPLVIDDRHHFSVVVDFADPSSALARATFALLERAR